MFMAIVKGLEQRRDKARLLDMIRNWKPMAKLTGGGTPGVAYQAAGSILEWSLHMVPVKEAFSVSRVLFGSRIATLHIK